MKTINIDFTSLEFNELHIDEQKIINGGSEFSNWSWEQIGKGVAYIELFGKAVWESMGDRQPGRTHMFGS